MRGHPEFNGPWTPPRYLAKSLLPSNKPPCCFPSISDPANCRAVPATASPGARRRPSTASRVATNTAATATRARARRGMRRDLGGGLLGNGRLLAHAPSPARAAPAPSTDHKTRTAARFPRPKEGNNRAGPALPAQPGEASRPPAIFLGGGLSWCVVRSRGPRCPRKAPGRACGVPSKRGGALHAAPHSTVFAMASAPLFRPVLICSPSPARRPVTPHH
jgi:hypothetical protein